jgi:hypothetical protein
VAISHVADLLSSQHNDQCNFLSNRKKSYRDFQSLSRTFKFHFLSTQNSRERQPFSSQFFETYIPIIKSFKLAIQTKKNTFVFIFSFHIFMAIHLIFLII